MLRLQTLVGRVEAKPFVECWRRSRTEGDFRALIHGRCERRTLFAEQSTWVTTLFCTQSLPIRVLAPSLATAELPVTAASRRRGLRHGSRSRLAPVNSSSQRARCPRVKVVQPLNLAGTGVAEGRRMRPSSRFLLRRSLMSVVLLAGPALVGGCDNGTGYDVSGVVSPRPTTSAPPPSDVDWPGPPVEPFPAPPPPAQGPGELLVAGDVRVLAATSDGHVVFFKGVIPTKALEVYDTKTKTTKVLVPSTANSDYVAISRDTVAIWSRTSAPFGHGTLRFWSSARGFVSVPGNGESLPYIFSSNDDGSRVAFMTGPTLGSSLGRIVAANPATVATTLEEIEPTVSGGCTIGLRHFGNRLFASSCGRVYDVATVRGLDAAGNLVFTHVDVKPSLDVSARGAYAVTVKIGGGGTLVDMATSAQTPLASDVTSARLSPDGAFLLTTTGAGALVRASTGTPGNGETVLPSGAAEVLAVSPDARNAIVATASISRNRGYEKRTNYALMLVSLEAPFSTIPLVTTTIGTPQGFTESGKYVLYTVAVSSEFDTELRARAVAGGPEIKLGANVWRFSPLAGTNAFVVHADGPQAPEQPSTITKIDLDSPTSSKLLASDVGPHVVVDRTVYIGARGIGLRAIPLP